MQFRASPLRSRVAAYHKTPGAINCRDKSRSVSVRGLIIRRLRAAEATCRKSIVDRDRFSLLRLNRDSPRSATLNNTRNYPYTKRNEEPKVFIAASPGTKSSDINKRNRPRDYVPRGDIRFAIAIPDRDFAESRGNVAPLWTRIVEPFRTRATRFRAVPYLPRRLTNQTASHRRKSFENVASAS